MNTIHTNQSNQSTSNYRVQKRVRAMDCRRKKNIISAQSYVHV